MRNESQAEKANEERGVSMSKDMAFFVVTVFDEEPKQLGLHSTSYLWKNMKQSFSTVPFLVS